MTDDPVLTALIAETAADPDRLGLLLHGSRAAGTARPDSDHDVICVLTEPAYAARVAAGTRLERRELAGGTVDVLYQSLGRIAELAAEPDWYTATYFPFCRVVLDRTGTLADRLADLREAAGRAAGERLMHHYEWYCTAFVRSLKCWRRGDALGARLNAAESAIPLVRVLYAAQGRWAPYHDHLARLLPELEAGLGWPPGSVSGALARLVTDPEPAFQQELQRRVAALLAERGQHYPWAEEPARVQEWDFTA